MHELDMAYSVVSIIDKEISSLGGASLKEFELEVGEFSGIDSDALQFSLDAVLKISPYYLAKVKISIIEASYRCKSCNHLFRPVAHCCSCPKCGLFMVEILQGEELKIKSLVIEKN